MTIEEAILLYVPALYMPKMREAIDNEMQQLRAERDELRETVERYGCYPRPSIGGGSLAFDQHGRSIGGRLTLEDGRTVEHQLCYEVTA